MTAILTNPRERARFLKFAVVGAIGAVVDFGAFSLLTKLLRVNPIAASMMSFSAAVTSNFIWNRYWTYPDSRSKPLVRQVTEFTIINIIGLVIRTPLFALLEGPSRHLFALYHLPPLSFDPNLLGDNFALAIAVVVVMFWNFFVNRYWTYNDVKS